MNAKKINAQLHNRPFCNLSGHYERLANKSLLATSKMAKASRHFYKTGNQTKDLPCLYAFHNIPRDCHKFLNLTFGF